MEVCIIVLNYNSGNYIEKCLDSLEKLAFKDFQIVIVDNNSTDGSLESIVKRHPSFKVVKSKENIGYAGGNNLGLQYALDNNFDAAWIVNPDIVVDKDSLTTLAATLENNQMAAAGSKVYFEKGFEFNKEKYMNPDLGKVIWFAGGKMDWDNVYAVHLGMDEVDHGQFDHSAQTDLLTGASMLLRTTALKKVGLLDKKYFLYYEENDLCQRLKQAGYSLWYCHDSVVRHANAQSTGIGSTLQDYYIIRNRLLFGMRWAPLKTKFALIRESIKLVLIGRFWQRRGAIDFYLRNFGKGSYEA